MPEKKSKRIPAPPVAPDTNDARPEPNGRQSPAEAAQLMDEMAAQGRARRQQIDAHGASPGLALQDDPTWQQRWDELLARVRSQLPDDLTPEEIEAEITRAAEAVRKKRPARRR